jgi:hypothetical protein
VTTEKRQEEVKDVLPPTMTGPLTLSLAALQSTPGPASAKLSSAKSTDDLNVPATPTTAAYLMPETPQSAQVSQSLDDLLAKMDASSASVQIRSSHESTPRQSASSSAQSSIEHLNQTTTDTEPSTPLKSPSLIVWSGRANMAPEGWFQGVATQLGGRAIPNRMDWEDLLPQTISIDGRIPHEPVHKYLDEVLNAPSREILLLDFTSDDSSPEAQQAFNSLFSFFHERKRYGVVGNRPKAVKDMYIMPIAKHDVLPHFMLGVDHELTTKNRRDVLMGVIVASRQLIDAIRAIASDTSYVLRF